MEQRRVRWPWIWFALITSVTVYLAVSTPVVVENGSADADWLIYAVLSVWYAGLGAIVASRVHGNRIAWLFLFVATGLVIEGIATLIVGAGPPSDPTAIDVLAITWLNTGFFFALVIPLVLLLYIFPTGRFLNRRWVWAGWVAGLASGIVVFGEAFATDIGPDDGTGNTLWTIANPIGFLHHPGMEDAGLFGMLFGIGLIVLMAMSIPAVIVRYRRSDTDVRAQIKWVLLALSFVSIMFFARIVFDLRFGTADYLLPIALAALPLSMTLAITRFRLYEIDRLISRTVAYVLLVALLGGIYSVGAVWLPTQLSGDQPPIFVAGSTLAVAALFNPVRRRILSWVDRRFNRTRYNAQRVVEDFILRIQTTTRLDQLTEDLTLALEQTLQPTSIGTWIRDDTRTYPERFARGPRGDSNLGHTS